MKIRIISTDELTGELAARWLQVQASSSRLSSPFFSPQFTQLVGAARDDVRVAVLERNDKVVGFFPFHRQPLRIGRPIGLGLSDCHGVIAEPETEWSASELLSACGVVRWQFDHLVEGQHGFTTSVRTWQPSPIIRLEQGIEVYEQSLDPRARKQLKEAQRKQQKLEDDYGSVRFVEHTDSSDVLETVFDLKSRQCRETGVTDYFSFHWTRQLIRTLHSVQHTDFRGTLSCLYAGEQLAAVHFGIRTDRVWHYWFPAYSADLSPYSPGLILLYKIIRSAMSGGLQYIDLGKGLSTYKRRVMNGQYLVGEGCVEQSALVNRLIHCAETMERFGTGSCIPSILTAPARVIRRIERSRRYR